MAGNEFTLDEIDDQAAEAMGGKHITITTPDGQQFHIDHPLFRDKKVDRALADLDDNDTDGIASILLGGDDMLGKFVDAGGTADHVNRVLFLVGMRMRDTVQGRPTRSSTSSGNGPKRPKRR